MREIGGKVDGFFQAEVAGGGADFDFVIAGVGFPLRPGDVVVGEVAGGDGELDGFGFAGLQRDFGEAFEFADGAVDGGLEIMEVKLRNFFAGAFAGIGDVRADGDGAVGRERGGGQREVFVFEGGVGQAVAEGEQRLEVVLVEMAVADVDAFGVIHDVIRAGKISEVRIIRAARGERVGQFAGGIHVAEKDVGDGVAAALAGEPGFDDAGNGFEPVGHGDGCAVVQHDNGVAIGGGDGADEGGLIVRQIHRGAVVPLAFLAHG